MRTSRSGPRYSRMDQVKLVEASLQKICGDMVCLGNIYLKTYPGKKKIDSVPNLPSHFTTKASLKEDYF